jgi:hypothetical protein
VVDRGIPLSEMVDLLNTIKERSIAAADKAGAASSMGESIYAKVASVADQIREIPIPPSTPPPGVVHRMDLAVQKADDIILRVEALERGQGKLVAGLEAMAGGLKAEHRILREDSKKTREAMAGLVEGGMGGTGTVGLAAADVAMLGRLEGKMAEQSADLLQMRDMLTRLLLRPICSCGVLAGVGSASKAAPSIPPTGAQSMVPPSGAAPQWSKPEWNPGEVKMCNHPSCGNTTPHEAQHLRQTKTKEWVFVCQAAVDSWRS